MECYGNGTQKLIVAVRKAFWIKMFIISWFFKGVLSTYCSQGKFKKCSSWICSPELHNLLKPPDLYVMRFFKFTFRTELVRKALCMLERNKLEEISKCKINVIEVMQIIHSSWNGITNVAKKMHFMKQNFKLINL